MALFSHLFSSPQLACLGTEKHAQLGNVLVELQNEQTDCVLWAEENFSWPSTLLRREEAGQGPLLT